jgi:hypothetical protein
MYSPGIDRQRETHQKSPAHFLVFCRFFAKFVWQIFRTGCTFTSPPHPPCSLYTVLRIRIRDPGSGAFLTPWIQGPRSGMGWGTTRILFPRATVRNHFFGLKYFNFLMRIWDPGWKNSDPGSGVEKSRIRDKDPGSATLIILTCFADLCSSGPVHKHRGGYRNTERIEYNA